MAEKPPARGSCGVERKQNSIDNGEVYAFCAAVFGWDQEQVDRQSALYLKTVIYKTVEMGKMVLGGLFKK